MATQQHVRRRDDARTPRTSHREQQNQHRRKRHLQTRGARKQVRRMGAESLVELQTLAETADLEGEV